MPFGLSQEEKVAEKERTKKMIMHKHQVDFNAIICMYDGDGARKCIV